LISPAHRCMCRQYTASRSRRRSSFLPSRGLLRPAERAGTTQAGCTSPRERQKAPRNPWDSNWQRHHKVRCTEPTALRPRTTAQPHTAAVAQQQQHHPHKGVHLLATQCTTVTGIWNQMQAHLHAIGTEGPRGAVHARGSATETELPSCAGHLREVGGARWAEVPRCARALTQGAHLATG
jgi:hypothetical protein